FKTYVRPLALPWPYLIAKGESVDQSVTLKVSGSAAEIESVEGGVTLTIGKQVVGNPFSPLGFALHPKDLDATKQSLDALMQSAPSHIVCYYDSRLGHSEIDLRRMADLGKAIGAELWLEFVVPSVDHFEQDIRELGRTVTELGKPFTAVMISPAPDLK